MAFILNSRCLENIKKIKTFISLISVEQTCDDLDEVVNNLHSTDDGEAREESHGAPYGGQLVHQLGCSVLQSELDLGRTDIIGSLSNPVKGRNLKGDLNKLESRFEFNISKIKNHVSITKFNVSFSYPSLRWGR